MREPIGAVVNDPDCVLGDELRRDAAARLIAMLLPVGTTADKQTPARMAKAFFELTSGYDDDVKQHMKTFEEHGDPGVVLVRELPFASVCEHHVLPFAGKATVAYIPDGWIIGLSKVARVLRVVSRRLQVQERIGRELADALMEHLEPKGVMVVLRAQHSCMALRGVESQGEMVTSCVRGVFATDHAARAEVLALLR